MENFDLKKYLAEGRLLKENVEGDFETYYERWEDEFALTNVPGVEGNVFNFDDEDEWEDDIRQPGSKIGDHSWEVSYEEEDDYYEPIINNMLNYLKKNKTYSYKNDDGVDAEFTYDDRGNSIDMSVIYSASVKYWSLKNFCMLKLSILFYFIFVFFYIISRINNRHIN